MNESSTTIELSRLEISMHSNGEIGGTTSVKVKPPVPCEQTNAKGNFAPCDLDEFRKRARNFGQTVNKFTAS